MIIKITNRQQLADWHKWAQFDSLACLQVSAERKKKQKMCATNEDGKVNGQQQQQKHCQWNLQMLSSNL